MRGIAIRQPFASLVALGARTIISTARYIDYRGSVAVVAVNNVNRAEFHSLDGIVRDKPACYFLEPYGYDRLERMPSGVVVARAIVAGCLPKGDRVVRAALARRPFEAALLPDEPRKDWALILTHVDSIKPEIRQPAAYGLFELAPETVGAILAAPLI